jgi:hypothetical protein
LSTTASSGNATAEGSARSSDSAAAAAVGTLVPIVVAACLALLVAVVFVLYRRRKRANKLYSNPVELQERLRDFDRTRGQAVHRLPMMPNPAFVGAGGPSDGYEQSYSAAGYADPNFGVRHDGEYQEPAMFAQPSGYEEARPLGGGYSLATSAENPYAFYSLGETYRSGGSLNHHYAQAAWPESAGAGYAPATFYALADGSAPHSAESEYQEPAFFVPSDDGNGGYAIPHSYAEAGPGGSSGYTEPRLGPKYAYADPVPDGSYSYAEPGPGDSAGYAELAAFGDAGGGYAYIGHDYAEASSDEPTAGYMVPTTQGASVSPYALAFVPGVNASTPVPQDASSSDYVDVAPSSRNANAASSWTYAQPRSAGRSASVYAMDALTRQETAFPTTSSSEL